MAISGKAISYGEGNIHLWLEAHLSISQFSQLWCLGRMEAQASIKS